MMFVETELRLIRARLAAVVLLVESGDAEMPPEARAELEKIRDYIWRLENAKGDGA